MLNTLVRCICDYFEDIVSKYVFPQYIPVGLEQINTTPDLYISLVLVDTTITC